ncbi:MAG: 2OG-Fe(II) oxygenase [Bacteroidia bacterium]|nr:2OG-Fe(II) oxygenase [Bacteroidia bacterium]MCF8425452.1 2OG-Fe(II) oxygenase [Bacteroidia bacterium]MCF8446266.1 2OG-Fe(II) oxygenase [Bacteroidia bacterium]
MIRFDYLEANKEKFRKQFLEARPFPHIGISDICDKEKLELLYSQIPEIDTPSADYVFAKNKFEKSKYYEMGGLFLELHEDLISPKFAELITYISNEDIFIDPTFYGGGIHQGRKGSFLDMHADFNYHPLHDNWYRNLNLLLYINKDWKKEYGGELKLEDGRTGEKTEVDVNFNTLAIMHCRSYTLHGYDPINFPENQYRTSIAAYAYTIHQNHMESSRTTVWHVKKENPLKFMLSKIWVPAVKLKSMFSKSKTADH